MQMTQRSSCILQIPAVALLFISSCKQTQQVSRFQLLVAGLKRGIWADHQGRKLNSKRRKKKRCSKAFGSLKKKWNLLQFFINFSSSPNHLHAIPLFSLKVFRQANQKEMGWNRYLSKHHSWKAEKERQHSRVNTIKFLFGNFYSFQQVFDPNSGIQPLNM